MRSAAKLLGEATVLAPKFSGSYAALSPLLAMGDARTARRDCDVARLAPDQVIVALRMVVGAPSTVVGDGGRKRDAILESVRRLKLIGSVSDALSLLSRFALSRPLNPPPPPFSATASALQADQVQ